MRPTKKAAIQLINNHGALLTYPVKNNPEAPSLWQCFYPKTPMRWEWTEDGDNRVALIWHLRAELSDSKKVVYTKWYKNRATFISFKLMTALLKHITKLENPLTKLSPETLQVYRALEDDSPLPTKILRIEAGLEGKENESKFNRALNELWNRLLIVGYGEVEEGGFPSLATGLTKHIFEAQWDASVAISDNEAQNIINKFLPAGTVLNRHYLRWLSKIQKLH